MTAIPAAGARLTLLSHGHSRGVAPPPDQIAAPDSPSVNYNHRRAHAGCGAHAETAELYPPPSWAGV